MMERGLKVGSERVGMKNMAETVVSDVDKVEWV